MDRGTVGFNFEFENGEVSMTLRRSEEETTNEFIKRVTAGSDAINALVEKGTQEPKYSWERPFLEKPAPVPQVEEERPAPRAIATEVPELFEE
jgi:hypothetical protein